MSDTINYLGITYWDYSPDHFTEFDRDPVCGDTFLFNYAWCHDHAYSTTMKMVGNDITLTTNGVVKGNVITPTLYGTWNLFIMLDSTKALVPFSRCYTGDENPYYNYYSTTPGEVDTGGSHPAPTETTRIRLNDCPNCTLPFADLKVIDSTIDNLRLSAKIQGVNELTEGLIFLARLPKINDNTDISVMLDLNNLGERQVRSCSNPFKYLTFEDANISDTYYPFVYADDNWIALSSAVTSVGDTHSIL